MDFTTFRSFTTNQNSYNYMHCTLHNRAELMDFLLETGR